MAKQKFYLKKVHSNRYLIWTLALVFMITIGLVSYINISTINSDTDILNQVEPIYLHQNKNLNLQK